jgi:hypothetical protein
MLWDDIQKLEATASSYIKENRAGSDHLFQLVVQEARTTGTDSIESTAILLP